MAGAYALVKCARGRWHTPRVRCAACEEVEVQRLLALDDREFWSWVCEQRSELIERAWSEVEADSGERVNDWALEVELGMNDAAVIVDGRLLARADALNRARKSAGRAWWAPPF